MRDSSDPALNRLSPIIESHRHRPGALLPLLHAIQDTVGHIPSGAIPLIAAALQRTGAEIEGVISFYHHFRRQPPGRHQLQLCRAEACQARGGEILEAHIRQRLERALDHEKGSESDITLEAVYCLGNCACGPNLAIDGQLMADMDSERFDRWLARTLNNP